MNAGFSTEEDSWGYLTRNVIAVGNYVAKLVFIHLWGYESL